MSKIEPIKILTPNHFARQLCIPRKKLEEIAASSLSQYSPYDRKKSNGKTRRIDNPHENIKQIQRRIYSVFLKHLPYPQYVTGGIHGRNPIAHVQIHTQAPIVVTIDIKSCFPSMTNNMVFSVWRNTLGFSKAVANLATRLTTFRGYLPQGGPASTALANLILLPAVSRIISIASEYNMRQPTMYIDDLAVSGKSLDPQLITLIAKEFSRIDLNISREKVIIMRKGKNQQVTKKGVSNRVVIPRKNRKKIWTALYQLEKLEICDAKQYASLKGRIAAIRSLHPLEFKKMMVRFIKLPKISTSQSKKP